LEVEDLEFLFLVGVCRPGFATVEEVAYNPGLIDIRLDDNGEVFVVPDPLG
jgi:hypothetical protein